MKVKKILAAVMATAALTAWTAAAPAAAAADPRMDGLWFHLQVHEGKDDAHVVINLPLSMVEKSAGFLRNKDGQNSSGRIRFNDTDMSKAELQDMWKDLRRQKDTTFLSVQETDGKVKMAKRGNYLLIQASDHGAKRENVEIKIPVPVVDALLSGPGEELNIAAGLQALVRAGEGEIMTVTGENETVRMWIDDQAETR